MAEKEIIKTDKETLSDTKKPRKPRAKKEKVEEKLDTIKYIVKDMPFCLEVRNTDDQDALVAFMKKHNLRLQHTCTFDHIDYFHFENRS